VVSRCLKTILAPRVVPGGPSARSPCFEGQGVLLLAAASQLPGASHGGAGRGRPHPRLGPRLLLHLLHLLNGGHGGQLPRHKQRGAVRGALHKNPGTSGPAPLGQLRCQRDMPPPDEAKKRERGAAPTHHTSHAPSLSLRTMRDCSPFPPQACASASSARAAPGAGPRCGPG
jgi:hypothetical protein